MAKQLSLKGIMEKPGVYLKRQREIRGINLEDISKVTKIQIKYLIALENDDDANLPSPTFVKGFIRLYCKYAGIDSDDAVLHYEEYLASKDGKTNNLTNKTDLQADEVPKNDKAHANSLPFIHNTTFLIIFFLFVLTAVVYYGYVSYNAKNGFNTEETKGTVGIGLTESSVPSADNPHQIDTSVAAKVEADKTNEAQNKADIPQGEINDSKKLKLEVITIKPTWIRVEIDDEKPIEVLLRDKDNIVWEGKKKFSLVIGNAAGVGLKFNGKPLGKLGENGQVVKLILPQEAGDKQ